MRGRPEIENSAAALLIGWGDPLAYLALDGAERFIADAILSRAAHLRSEEMTRMAEAIGSHCAAALSRMFR